jgi:polyhydroxyalkanoate synthesis repressor PhaR
MTESQESAETPPDGRRIIKRYSNRKLYDTKGSRYVTLLQIAEMVRAGEDVQIIDNATKEDKTDVTLALIISEELKTRPRAIPLPTLKLLIRHRGERILTQLREGPIGRLVSKDQAEAMGLEEAPTAPGTLPEEEEDVTSAKDAQGKGLRATLENWQSTIDERIRAVLPDFSTIRELQQQVQSLAERLDALERKLGGSDGKTEE